jgi:hypothetical protein
MQPCRKQTNTSKTSVACIADMMELLEDEIALRSRRSQSHELRPLKRKKAGGRISAGLSLTGGTRNYLVRWLRAFAARVYSTSAAAALTAA